MLYYLLYHLSSVTCTTEKYLCRICYLYVVQVACMLFRSRSLHATVNAACGEIKLCGKIIFVKVVYFIHNTRTAVWLRGYVISAS